MRLWRRGGREKRTNQIGMLCKIAAVYCIARSSLPEPGCSPQEPSIPPGHEGTAIVDARPKRGQPHLQLQGSPRLDQVWRQLFQAAQQLEQRPPAWRRLACTGARVRT